MGTLCVPEKRRQVTSAKPGGTGVPAALARVDGDTPHKAQWAEAPVPHHIKVLHTPEQERLRVLARERREQKRFPRGKESAPS